MTIFDENKDIFLISLKAHQKHLIALPHHDQKFKKYFLDCFDAYIMFFETGKKIYLDKISDYNKAKGINIQMYDAYLKAYELYLEILNNITNRFEGNVGKDHFLMEKL